MKQQLVAWPPLTLFCCLLAYIPFSSCLHALFIGDIWFVYLWFDPYNVKKVWIATVGQWNILMQLCLCLIAQRFYKLGGFDTDYNPDFYSLGLNVLVLGRKQLSYKQRNLSAPHQTKIVDWLGPPHSFTVWHGPRLEWCWWCCWGGGGGVSLGTDPGLGEGRKQNTTSLCSSALKDSPSCDNCTKSQTRITI